MHECEKNESKREISREIHGKGDVLRGLIFLNELRVNCMTIFCPKF